LQFKDAEGFIFSVEIAQDEQFLSNGKNPTLTVMSAGHALHIFIYGQLTGKTNDSIPLLLPLSHLLSLPLSLSLSICFPIHWQELSMEM
jgi:hypothetical protein